MAEAKSRYIEYRPDEYIAGVAAKLNFEEQGMYWMICSLIMSHGGPIENDIDHIAGLGKMTRTKARNLLAKLLVKGKITENDGILSQKRSENEVILSLERIENASKNGAKGGRPRNKNNGLTKAKVISTKKLTNNQEPITNNHICEEFINLYPKKDRLEQAVILLETIDEDHETVIGGLKLWCDYWRAEKTPEQFIPFPTTWVKEQRWLDKPKCKPSELDRFLNS